MAPRGAPGPASAESAADRAGRGKRDSRGGRGPSVSGPASPLRRTPAPPAAPRRAGQCQEDRPGPSPNRPHPPDSGKAVTWRASGGEDTTQKRKVRRQTVASGPGRFGKFGRLVPHWVTAVRCARAPGPSRPMTPPLLTLPSRGRETAAKARAQRQPALPARGRARRHVTAGPGT
ncbi:atherin-like [Orcinus orca]|uniref:atherin-like n=1 Tax=Orcinus orca TaxID=9733 RepID=UPI0014422271|nr:atherin-like [Orcinus orca]